MADVFISYAREDRARAEQVARGLGAMGLDVFWDSEIPPGKTWADYIEEKLTQCKAMVVLWSAHSTKSQWVREEARMGRDKGALIPVMIDNSQAPFGFGEVQAADLSTWRGESSHAGWVRFANAVDSAVRGPNAAPRPVPAAPAATSTAFIAPGDSPQSLSPPGYVLKCLRMYLNGSGRARRMEYWSFALFQLILMIAGMAIDLQMFGMNDAGTANTQLFFSIVALATLCPAISVASRRFHDVGLSGWLVAPCYLLIFVFGLGGLIIFVVSLIPGQKQENKYGPDPKAA